MIRFFHFHYTTMRISKMAFSALFVVLSGFSLQAQDSKDAALETIGAVSGAMLYNSYTTLGILADAYAAEAYESDFSVQLIDEQIAIYSELKSQFTNLLDSDFLTDPNDQEFTRDIAITLSLLIDEAEALKSYIESPDGESEGDLFQERRQAAWDKISYLLGIE